MNLHLSEISRRGVFKTLAAYAVGGWFVIEAVSVVAPAFRLPDWSVAAVTTVVVLGAFPMLLLSWRYEVTAGGITRDRRLVSDEIERFARRLSIVLVAVLIAVTATLWVNYFRVHSEDALGTLVEAQQGAPEIGADGLIRSIAVLPFVDFSPSPGRRLLADGIPEAILHVLAQNSELLVTARTSSFFFRDKTVTAAEIGRILGVQALLEGSVQVHGDRLKVTSQLVRTADQGHIWSNVYEGPVENVFEIQDQIAYTVRDLVLAKAGSHTASLVHADHPSLEAYELLLEAKSLLTEETLEATDRSIALLELALDISPDYADAHAWMANAVGQKTDILAYQRGEAGSKMAALNKLIETSAATALQLDPDNAVAILWKGQMSQGEGGQGYFEAKRRALEVAPNDPDILYWLATLEYQNLELETARRHLDRARSVDPGNVDVMREYLLHFCGRKTLVPMVESQVRNYQSSTLVALRLRALANHCDGNYVDAATAQARLVRLDPEPVSAVTALRWLVQLGDAAALAEVDRAHKLTPGLFVGYDYEFGLPDSSIFFEEIAEQRKKTFDWHRNAGANPFFFMIRYAYLQIQLSEFDAALSSIGYARKIWDDYYEFRDPAELSRETLTIYALQAWLLRQTGEGTEAAAMARQLQTSLENKKLATWEQTRGQLGDIPLHIFLLNDQQVEAMKWLQAAAADRWMDFQPVLASPIYAEFRRNETVTATLSRLATQRAEILASIKAAGLPEAERPSLLTAKMLETVPPSPAHLADIALNVDGDLEQAIAHLETGLRTDLSDRRLLVQAMHLAHVLGQFDDVELLLQTILNDDPEDSIAFSSLGLSRFYRGRLDAAIDSLRRALEVDPSREWIHRWIGTALLLKGERLAALESMEKLPDGPNRLLGLAMAYHELGRFEESREMLNTLIDEHGIRFAYNIGYVLAYCGHVDEAFEWLDRAKRNNNGALRNATYQPLLANLHGDPRWRQLLQDLGHTPEQLAGLEIDLTSGH